MKGFAVRAGVLILSLLATLPLHAKQKVLDVCQVLGSVDRLHKKTITIQGYVSASYHLTLLESPNCKGTIAIASPNPGSPGIRDSLFRDFENGVARKASGREPRKFFVVIRGRFESNVPWRDDVVLSRVILLKVIKAQFESE